MSVTYLTRYDHSGIVDGSNLSKVTNDLLIELKTEQFDEPDDEHTQVSIGNDRYAVTAQVSGLITLENLDLLERDSSPYPESL